MADNTLVYQISSKCLLNYPTFLFFNILNLPYLYVKASSAKFYTFDAIMGNKQEWEIASASSFETFVILPF